MGSIAVSVATAVSFLSVTTGSLAWYAYSRTVLFSYVGTSVAKSVLMNVGLVDDSNYLKPEKLTEYDLVREDVGIGVNRHSVVFTRSSNGLDYHAINDYLFWSPYAVSLLYPVTTKTRDLSRSNGLTLYKSPDFGETSFSTVASTSDYVRIPLAFKSEQAAGAGDGDQFVWLTDVTVEASGQHIDRAVRVFVDSNVSKFVMKPEERNALTQGERDQGQGSTKVGGLLDLDGDGTYDYDPSIGQTHSGEEYYYGEHSGTITYANTRYGKDEDEAPFDNVNGVSAEEQTASTFYAKHHASAYVADLSNVTPARAHYYTFGDVRPDTDTGGRYTEGDTGIPITKIDSTSGVGYATFTIYLEGWDHSIIDKSAGYSFNLGLKFEINRT